MCVVVIDCWLTVLLVLRVVLLFVSLGLLSVLLIAEVFGFVVLFSCLILTMVTGLFHFLLLLWILYLQCVGVLGLTGVSLCLL